MTRDERMAKLLDCVNFYATMKFWDAGLNAQAVMEEIVEDERNAGLREELASRDRPSGD